MHYRLMSGEGKWTPASVAELAGSFGFEAGAFGECMLGRESGDGLAKLRREAAAADVKGTPAVFINGRRMNSPSGIDYFTLKAAVAEARHSSGSVRQTGGATSSAGTSR